MGVCGAGQGVPAKDWDAHMGTISAVESDELWLFAGSGEPFAEADEMTFEAVEFIELTFQPGRPAPPPRETVIGSFESEEAAIDHARLARKAFRDSSTSARYAWWVVRQPGSQLANWIADSSSDREFVLDLRTGQLIEIT